MVKDGNAMLLLKITIYHGIRMVLQSTLVQGYYYY